ncbi:hypothetical protein [Microcoleus sp. POL10_C6]|uniref:hypothetical protein n=2 Tax=Microcoleus TaxID=44471 RepID=UPI002FD27CF5
MNCKIPGCPNPLVNGRTYECGKCTSEILAAARYVSRPLSELLGDLEDVTSQCNPNPDKESDRPTRDYSKND